MIVKNESHIIEEALKCTLPLVDTYAISDTGSTDNTIRVIQEFYEKHGISGIVEQTTWKDFGTNRSQALALCDGRMDYILVIDADDLMTFPENGREQLETILTTEAPNLCMMSIHQGDLRYSRAQIFKADDGWKYKGVLHEYPTNEKEGNITTTLPHTFWMESRRLGDRSRVEDKMLRDIRVLEDALKKEPDNERYVFYLAQSYRDRGDFTNAIKWYKKRFNMGRWAEEQWVSAYNVGVCYKYLQKIPHFEKWMQIAFDMRPSRAEPIHHLAQYYREKGQHYKAYHYVQIGRNIPVSKDVLFVETDLYGDAFTYEASVLDYYIHSDKKHGLRSCIQYLLKKDQHLGNVFDNMRFYVEPIPSLNRKLELEQVFGKEFRPTAISIHEYPYANVRFVNFLPPEDGAYRTADGSDIQTYNAYMNLENGKKIKRMKDERISLTRRDTRVHGLEDLRLGCDNRFFATCYGEYAPGVHMMTGIYNTLTGDYENATPIKSPVNAECEKNWLPFGKDDVLYHWHPLRVGKLEGDELRIHTTVDTPPLFSLFRGSAPPIEKDGKWVAMVHLVHIEQSKRLYYHALVEMEKDTYVPTRVSLPFVFRGQGIEYCISMRMRDSVMLECFVTFMDSNPHSLLIDWNNIEWLRV